MRQFVDGLRQANVYKCLVPYISNQGTIMLVDGYVEIFIYANDSYDRSDSWVSWNSSY